MGHIVEAISNLATDCVCDWDHAEPLADSPMCFLSYSTAKFLCVLFSICGIFFLFFFFTWPTPSDSSKFKLPTRMHLTNSSHLSAWPTRLHSVHFPSKDPIFQCLSKRLSPSHYKGSLCFTYESPVPRAEQEPLLGT